MKKILFILILTCSTLILQAQTKEDSKVAELALELNGLSPEKMQPILVETFKSQGIEDELSRVLAEKVVKGEAFAKFKKKVVQMYVDHFTEEELQDLVRFYETEIGKRLLEELPKITAELAGYTLEYEKDLSEELTNFFEALKIIE